jgi:hypothetical protein
MNYRNRTVSYADFDTAKIWMNRRLSWLDKKVALPCGGLAIECMQISSSRSLVALVCLVFIIIYVAVNGSKPPAILTPGSTKNLHPTDALLIKAARHAYQNFWYVAQRSPLFLISYSSLWLVCVLSK